MRNSVSAKLGWGLALLLVLFVAATLISFWQSGLVRNQVREITDVDEQKSAAAFELEINVIRSGTAVINYLETGDLEMRLQFNGAAEEFQRLEERYGRAAHTKAEHSLADNAGSIYWRSRAMGGALMDQVDQKSTLMERVGQELVAADLIIAARKNALSASESPNNLKKINTLIRLEVQRAKLGTAMSAYLLPRN